MKLSQWRRAVENRCVFSACLKVLSDRSGDHSAGERRLKVLYDRSGDHSAGERRLKVLSDRSGDHGTGERCLDVVGPLSAKLRYPVAVPAHRRS